jgi:hypothetical protein
MSIEDVINSLEKEKINEQLEGLQFIYKGTVLEIVMSSDDAKNTLLEKGLDINGFHHHFQKSNPFRQPYQARGNKPQETHVSVFGLPIEAKNFQVGKYLEEMGFGKHILTRPVMRKTENGTSFYSGILVAVMQEMTSPIPVFLNVRGYAVRTKHTGQEESSYQKNPSAPVETTTNSEITEVVEVDMQLSGEASGAVALRNTGDVRAPTVNTKAVISNISCVEKILESKVKTHAISKKQEKGKEAIQTKEKEENGNNENTKKEEEETMKGNGREREGKDDDVKKELSNKRKLFYFENPGKKKTTAEDIKIMPVGEGSYQHEEMSEDEIRS